MSDLHVAVQACGGAVSGFTWAELKEKKAADLIKIMALNKVTFISVNRK